MREEGERIMRKPERNHTCLIDDYADWIIDDGLHECQPIDWLWLRQAFWYQMFYGNYDVYRDFGIASQYACIDRTVSPGQYKKGNTGRKTGWRRRRLVYGKS